tara:strand:+ start:13968 stop:21302 length:7335 start_codon:yes stop_codon:yes gene_type:complete
MSINIDVQGNTTPLERDVQAAVKRINRSGGVKIRIDEKGVTQPLGNMKRSADEFTKSLEASNARVLAFGASVGIINAVADAFKGLVTSTMKVEKNLTDINVVMGLTNKQLDKFGGGLFKVAKETGAGFDAASEAATEFARQGLSVNETLKRTKDALILTRLTGMKAAESVKSLTAAMNTFKGEISDSTKLVSKFAAVDVKFAVSAEDFAQAIARSGQAARDAGVDLNDLIGLVTAVQERTARGGAVIGNSFKTIFTRVQRSSTLNELENIGIAVRDISGNTLPAIRILESLAKKYDHLNDAQRAYISQNVAGVFQVNILKAALSDLSKANSVTAQATKIASNATDESSRKNEQLRETMSALAGETGVAVQQLAKTIGDIALAPGINKILDGIKGLAEGATNLLGNGEDQGNTFAKGVLKGIGNIITGPGLVVIGALFTKLFVNAAKYATSSLSSLLNMNKAAAGRKSIETSLMQVLTQNAALQQEMLRTDISREQKEKTILNLIKQQTTEAARLASITKSMTPSLMRQGVGPNLSYSRRGAYGFIPNYAKDDQEKKMARSAGYTPGHIKTMNIPGAGGMIYNSSETVKNFPGLSQPAIMPPASSKAGENYKKIFASTHGFDPYAAQGYIPNFSLVGALQRFAAGGGKLTGLATSKHHHGNSLEGALINEWKASGRSQSNLNKGSIDAFITANAGKFDNKTDLVSYKGHLSRGRAVGRAERGITNINAGGSSFVVLTADEQADNPNQHMFANRSGQIGGSKGTATTKILKKPAAYKIATPLYGMGPGEEKKMQAKKSRSIQNELQDYMTNGAIDLATDIMGKPIKPINKSHIESSLNKGAVSAAAGGIFESGIASIMDKVESEGLFQNYMARTDTSAIDLPASPQLYELFGVKNKGQAGAEAKISMSEPNIKSSAKKFLDILGPKSKDAFAYADSNYKESEKFRRMRQPGRAAAGYIPNYDDPLTASIKREKSAGVPVSKIRVGSHRALVGRSNPMGLGVTNTDDEPGGLKDLFGAKGFVPNYALGDMLKMGTQESIDNANEQVDKLSMEYDDLRSEIKEAKRIQEEANAASKENQNEVDEYTKAIEKDKEELKRKRKGSKRYNELQNRINNTTQKLDAANNKLTASKDRSSAATNRVSTAENKLKTTSDKLATARRGATRQTRAGSMRSAAPMALAMGLPMVSGMISQAAGENKTGQGIAGGLTGAATGAMMGSMILPGVGTAIGTVVGALAGAVSSYNQASKAADEKKKADEAAAEAARKNAQAFNENSFAQTAAKAAATNTLLKNFSGGNGGIGALGLNNNFSLNVASGEISQNGFPTPYTGLSLKQAAAREAAYEKNILSDRSIHKSLIDLSDVEKGGPGNGMRSNIEKIYGFSKQTKQQNFKKDMTRAAIDIVNSGSQGNESAIENLRKKYPYKQKEIDDFSKMSRGEMEMMSLLDSTTSVSGAGKTDLEALLNGTIKTDNSAIKNAEEVARKLQNEIVANLYGTGKEADRVHTTTIANTKTKDGKPVTEHREVKMTGKDMAILQRGGKESLELGRKLGMTEKDIETFKNGQLLAVKQQSQIIQDQTNAFIKTLNFQSIELKVRHDLNKSLQSQAHSATELSNKNKALSAIMGKNLKEATRVSMQTEEQRLAIKNQRSKSDLTAESDFRSGLFKSISGNTVASDQFRTVFGADQKEDGTIEFKNNAGLKQLFTGLGKNAGTPKFLEKQYNKYINTAESDGVESALSGIDIKVLKAMVEQEDGILKNNAALRRQLEGLILKRENALELSKKDFDFSDQQLTIISKINSDLAKQSDIRKDISDRIDIDSKKLASQVAIAQKTLEIEKLRRQVAQGPGYQTASVTASNQLQDIDETFNIQELAMRGENNIQRRSYENEILNPLKSKLRSKSEMLSNPKNTPEQSKVLREQYTKISKDIRKAEESQAIIVAQQESEIENLIKMRDLRKEMIKDELNARGSFSAGMNESLRKMSDESSDFYNNLGQMIPNAFANNLSNAMTNAIKQGGSLKDSLKDAALSFLQTMNQAFAQQFARNATLAIFGSGEEKFRGGLVKRNKGGLVPGMLTNGEYRMNPGAVSKYGVSMMDSLNAGHLPKRNSGGMMSSLVGFGVTAGLQSLFKKKEEPKHEVRKKDRFETDGAFKKHNMSAHYMQNNSRAQAYVDELRQQKAEQTRKFIEKAEKRAQRGRAITQFIGNMAMGKLGKHLEKSGAFARADIALGQGTEISTADGLKGIMAPGGKIKLTEDIPFGPAGVGKAGDVMDIKKLKSFGYKFGKGNVDRVAGGDHGWWSNAAQSIGSFGEKSMGMARKFGYKNSGGSVTGPSGIDRIPTMLSEGEYVIRADAARKIGRPALEKINSGRYNSGGIVASNSSGLDGASPQSGGVNNISITVNVDGSGGQSGEKKDNDSNGDKKDKMDKMSAKIKDQVVTVIKEESRPGGLLDKGGDG